MDQFMPHHPWSSLPPEMWEAVARYLKPEDLYKLAEAFPFWSNLLQQRRLLPITWLRGSNGSIPAPKFAVRGGIDGARNVYIARASHHGGRGLIVGKLIAGNEFAEVGWGWILYPKVQYEILVAPPDTVSWVETEGSNVPHNAILGGHDFNQNQDPYYVGRVLHRGSVTVGKVHANYSSCYVPHGLKEHSYRKYEILVRNALGKALNA